ncbi:alpha/beta fold hydrolase [Kitasatospora sp. NPDC101235]|uniref:thioesterase domain-containing protein n=1 Tax=Kitasatospora sp. NPDC101235 TaxID=3364101 RepID=UPI0038031179
MTARAVVVPLSDSTAPTTAHFLPGVDGGLRPACAFAELVRDRLAVHGVMLTGTDHPDAHDVEVQARLALDAVVRKTGGAPDRLIGYSYGALVALEMAHQALARGLSVPGLLLLDTPVTPGPQKAPSPVTMFWYIGQGAGLDLTLTEFAALGPERRGAEVARWCATRSPGFDLRAARTVYATIEANCAAWAGHTARPWSGPADVIIAEDSAETGGDRADWSEVFPDGYRTRTVPGGHRDVLSEAGAVALARAVTDLTAPL